MSYIVTTVPTKNAAGAITAATATRPSTDSTTGTLVDNNDGSYTYTFYRDITQVKVAAGRSSPPHGNNVKADLGDMTYEPTWSARPGHPVVRQCAGHRHEHAERRAGWWFRVPMMAPVDYIYDFIPATGAKADSGREIASTAKCNRMPPRLGGIPGTRPESSGRLPAAAAMNVRYCVVCHDQRKLRQG